MIFFHKVPLASSMCSFMWIKVDKLDYLKIGSRDFKNYFLGGSYNFLAYLECVRSYAWSKRHSDPDLSSVWLVWGRNKVYLLLCSNFP